MSVAMTNWGSLGWLSAGRGYRYDACDSLSGRPWPPMPQVFLELARSAAQAGGVPGFTPHPCLLNPYHPRAPPTLPHHKDERHFSPPTLSVPLPPPPIFPFRPHSPHTTHRP